MFCDPAKTSTNYSSNTEVKNCNICIAIKMLCVNHCITSWSAIKKLLSH